jgi:NAD(P)H dehydrogenase (quinone)
VTTIAVTGSTGRLGAKVARRLAAAGARQRLVVRDRRRAPELAGAEVVRAEYGDADSSRAALAGIDVVFMVSASETVDRVARHLSFVDAAVEAGVAHLVYLSFYGASPSSTFILGRHHWETEQRVRSRELAFTFLRDNIYADFLPLMVGPDGVIRGPAGRGRVALVAQDDIADVAAAVLSSPEDHRGRTYDLTGPEAIDLDEAAAVVTEVTGRTVTYHPESIDEAYASRASYGAPDWQVDAWVSTYTAIAAGELAGVSDDVARVTGHPAMPLREVLRRQEGAR